MCRAQKCAPAVVEVVQPAAAHAAGGVDERHLVPLVLEARLNRAARGKSQIQYWSIGNETQSSVLMLEARLNRAARGTAQSHEDGLTTAA